MSLLINKSCVCAPRRTFVSAVGALLASAGLASPASAAVWSWNTGNGNWLTPGNWSSNSVPVFGNDVMIGNLPGVQNSTVIVNPEAITIGGADLFLSSGMTLDLNNVEWASFQDVNITGAGSRLIVRPTPIGVNPSDFQSETHIGVGSHFEVADNALAKFYDASYNQGTISGRGTILLESVIPFRNDGVIVGSGNGGLVLSNSVDAAVDLDGATGGGQLLLATPFSQLTFHGIRLEDSFSGTVTMGSGSFLDMDLSDGWTADASSTFNVSNSLAGAAAQIDGGHFTFGGDLNIGGSEGHLRVLADTTLSNTADVFLGTDDRLEFDGATTVQGGAYTFSGGLSVINFDGPTTMQGGAFNMSGPNISNGRVEFNGETTWSGTVNISGLARQTGDATVSGPTVINGNRFIMDGTGGDQDTVWTVNHSLTVNADRINFASNFFNGTMNISGGVFGRTTINLDNPSESWYMFGTMNLAGAGALPVTRVAGSPLVVGGGLNASSGTVQITADTTFSSVLGGASVNIAGGATLRMRANTIVDAATQFVGTGTLQNGNDGAMLLHSGVSLGSVGLSNNSILRIGESGPGVAAVDRFVSTVNAFWAVDIGGYVAGTKHDLLLVTGGAAALNGQLTVSVLTGFSPQIGDEFTILSALGGVSGTFTNDPVSQANGLAYDWTIIYNPNTVVLRLDSIVPTPGSAALLAMAGLVTARRRR